MSAAEYASQVVVGRQVLSWPGLERQAFARFPEMLPSFDAAAAAVARKRAHYPGRTTLGCLALLIIAPPQFGPILMSAAIISGYKFGWTDEQSALTAIIIIAVLYIAVGPGAAVQAARRRKPAEVCSVGVESAVVSGTDRVADARGFPGR